MRRQLIMALWIIFHFSFVYGDTMDQYSNRVPSSRGVVRGIQESVGSLDPADKPRDDDDVLNLAPLDQYPFSTSAQQQQFQGLINQLRCLVCQNQDLADSNADLAKDLRHQVYTMVLANQSDAQIKQYMVERYGNFVLFKPPFNPQTLLLWLLPFILLIIGFIILWRLANSRKNSS